MTVRKRKIEKQKQKGEQKKKKKDKNDSDDLTEEANDTPIQMFNFSKKKKKCGDKEEVQYTAPNHGNSGAEKPFFTIKKTTLQNFKKKTS